MNENDPQEQVDDLLADWELARENGNDIPIDKLCINHPELREKVTHGIAKLNATSWMMVDAAICEPLKTPARKIETRLPDATVTMEEFVESVDKSGILTDTSLLEVKQQASIGEPSVNEFAEDLIEKGVLTNYQARVLLEKGKSPLLLDRYIILDTLGEGGMGIVFKALHRSMDRIVALKVLPRFATNSHEKVSRFQREIKAVARIAHPNVVAAYDAHESNGTWFLVMEYVDGQNLTDYVNENGPLSVDEALKTLSQIASGLAESHKQGIIHRDIKPSNIMLTSAGVAKLLDLGLARSNQLAKEVSHTELTRDGIAMGTVDYMSPEQALDAKEADAQSDIYSLGCTLYFLLAGKAPFESSSAVRTIVAHRESDAPELLPVQEAIPDWLCQTYRKMVAKNPEDRHLSVTELQHEFAAQGVGVNLNSPVVAPRKLSKIRSNAIASSKKSRQASLFWKSLAAGLVVAAIVIAAFALNGFWKPVDNSVIQHDVAKWVISNGGNVTAQTEFELHKFSDAAELPEGEISIVQVGLEGNGDNDSLKPLAKIDTIEELYLGNCNSDLRELQHLDLLKVLVLDGCIIDHQDIQVIRKMKNLNVLDLRYSTLDTNSLRFITELTRLRELELTGVSFPLQDLKVLKSLPALRAVSFRNTAIKDDDLSCLPGWITKLRLANCDISDECADHIKQLTNLRMLDLKNTRISDACLVELSTLHGLESLDLSATNISNGGLQSLKAFPRLKKLQLMNFKFTPVMVDTLKSLQSLVELDLESSDIDDDGFLELVELKNLGTIWIYKTPISQPAIDKFYRARSDVSIYCDDDKL